MRFKLPFLACASLLALAACNSTGPGSSSPDSPLSSAGAYNISADGKGLVIRSVSPYCEGSNLIRDPYTDSEAFSLSGNTLVISIPDTLGYFGVVTQSLTFTRSGSGSGLPGGVWKQQSRVYQITSGSTRTLPLRKARRQRQRRGGGRRGFSIPSCRRSSSCTADSAYDYANVQQAEEFLADWNLGDSAEYSINVTAAGADVAQLKGKKTTQTVRITYAANAATSLTYTTDVAGDSAFQFYQMPTSCPDPDAPNWYYAFLSANAKSSSFAKAAALAKSSPVRARKLHRRGLF